MSYSDNDDEFIGTVDYPVFDISTEMIMAQHSVKSSGLPAPPEMTEDYLSTRRLITLLYDINPEYVETMVSLVTKYDMVVSSALKGWKGIDSKLCIRLIHVTCEWKSDRVRLPDRASSVSLNGKFKPTLNEIDRVIIEYYKAIWNYYSGCFSGNTPYIMTIEKGKR